MFIRTITFPDGTPITTQSEGCAELYLAVRVMQEAPAGTTYIVGQEGDAAPEEFRKLDDVTYMHLQPGSENWDVVTMRNDGQTAVTDRTTAPGSWKPTRAQQRRARLARSPLATGVDQRSGIPVQHPDAVRPRLAELGL